MTIEASPQELEIIDNLAFSGNLEFKKECVKQSLANSQSQPTALKSEQAIRAEIEREIDKDLEIHKNDLKHAFNLYHANLLPSQQNRWEQFINKMQRISPSIQQENISIPEEDQLNPEDLQFLEEIANIEVEKGNYSDAACMYRFLVKIEPNYSLGWTCWANCEMALGNVQRAEMIYELVLESMPGDNFIRTFVANFYIGSGKNDKAKALLKEAIESMSQNEDEKNLECFTIAQGLLASIS
jgi:tetratricopeptide (TPR) repeat protein